jgi:MYXO-CTERM domain-containing protein
LTSLERAKKFLSLRVTKLAMAAMPLAAVALSVTPAKASNVNTFNPTACNVNTGSGSCFQATAAQQGGDPNASWLQVWSNLIYSSAGNVVVSASGTYVGDGFVAGEIIPLSWDFQTSGTGTFNWSLSLWFSDGSHGAGYSGGGTGPAGAEIRGSSQIIVPTGISGNGTYNVDLFVNGVNSVTVPGGGTLDLNPTPEPASGLLAGLGMAAAWLLRRRRKA